MTVPNRAPHITDTIPSVEVEAGDEATVDVSEYFTDPDEDPLTFEAESSQADVAGTETSGSIITVTAVGGGHGDHHRHRDRSRRARGRRRAST